MKKVESFDEWKGVGERKVELLEEGKGDSGDQSASLPKHFQNGASGFPTRRWS